MAKPIGVLSSTNFGDFEVLYNTSDNKSVVRFLSTGYTTTAYNSNIRRGEVKDKLVPNVHGVGFIGGDTYNVKHKAYAKWADMLKRCYDCKYQEKQTTYKGASVCEEWWNFQNFAKWFEDNYVEGSEVDLDKDINGCGNKVYSPETCTLVVRCENVKKAHNCHLRIDRVISPEGVEFEITNRYAFCQQHKLPRSSFCRLLTGERDSYKGWVRA